MGPVTFCMGNKIATRKCYFPAFDHGRPGRREESEGCYMLKFYGYKKCDTCRKAEKALAKLGKEYEFVDITLEPPSQSGLKKIVQQSGAELKKFFNTSG